MIFEKVTFHLSSLTSRTMFDSKAGMGGRQRFLHPGRCKSDVGVYAMDQTGCLLKSRGRFPRRLPAGTVAELWFSWPFTCRGGCPALLRSNFSSNA